IVSGILVWLLLLDFKLGLISVGILPLLIAASVYFSRRLKIAYRDARNKLSALNAFLAENLLGIRVINLFNRQALHSSRFDRINQWYADAQVDSIRIFAFFQPSITLASGAAIALVIWFGGKSTAEGSLQLGVLVAYFSYVLSLFQPLREIADKWNIFLSGMTSAERIFSILGWQTEVDAGLAETKAFPIADVKGKIVFENVWFAYEEGRWIFRDLSLQINLGEHIALVGHTGAGKTTLINLLLRFYEPQKGRILLDGKDIREYDRRSLRTSFGVVQQDVFLFSGSFNDNITFWDFKSGRNNNDLMNDLRRIGLDNLITTNENKLQERASNVSIGEKQVLAFARALAMQPKIWILDEATSNMDSTTEMVLLDALKKASNDRTLLMIAHRLATLKSAGRILVLHKGVLVEDGRHSDLVNSDGLYSRLYKYQVAQEVSRSRFDETARDTI
ncbi:MAG: ABC transporter ATP-binding protein, partial [Candidatus Poribacteria bacterium]